MAKFTKRYFFHCRNCNGVYDTHAPIYIEPGLVDDYHCPDCVVPDQYGRAVHEHNLIACCDYDSGITTDEVRAVAKILWEIPNKVTE